MNDVSPFAAIAQKQYDGFKRHVNDKFRQMEEKGYIVTVVFMSRDTLKAAYECGLATLDAGRISMLTSEVLELPSIPYLEVQLKRIKNVETGEVVRASREDQ